MSANRNSLWQNRSFLLLMGAYFISAFGDHLTEAAIIKEMGIEDSDEKTRIGAQLLFFFFLPYVLLGPFAGATADRLPRKAILITADIARAAIALLMPFYIGLLGEQQQSGWLMMMPILGMGVFAAFFNPARQALVPQVVEDHNLTRGNSLLNGLAPVASIISYVIGSWLASIPHITIGAWRVPGTTVNFMADAVTFVGSAILIAMMVVSRRSVSEPTTRRSVTADIALGFRYIRGHRYVWQLMLFTAMFWTAAGAFSSIITTVVLDWYPGMTIAAWGPFRATLGGGMLIGAGILAWVGEASRGHINLMLGAAGSGALMILFSLTRTAWLGAVLAVGIGLFGVWIVISANTLLQRIVPNRSRGRIFGIVDLVNMTGMVLATFLLGIVVIPGLDQMIAWILRGLGAVLLFIGLGLWWHHVRRMPHPVLVVMVYWVAEVLSRLWYRLRRVGVCTVPRSGGCIIAANHTSGIDTVLIATTCPHRLFGYLIAREYAGIALFKHLIRHLGCIAVRRDGRDIAATKQAMRHLRDGRALGVFIQGRIQGPTETHEPRDGVAVLALRTGVPVIPVHISGIRYEDSLLRSYFRRHQARVAYGPAVDLSDCRNPRDRGQVEDATQRVWSAIQALAPDEGGVYLS